MTISLKTKLTELPVEASKSLLPEIRNLLQQSQRTIFVLDDDPTGTQTVYDTPVLTTWSQEAIQQEWQQGHRLIYILTNSRSLTEPAARELAKEIGNNIAAVAKSIEQAFTVISRSDSTLRGHYPAEVDALADAIGCTTAPQIIIPYFLQGGRFTIDDVHYVADADQLIPASETAFAKDAAFGFQNSNLIDWVIEKRQGAIAPSQVTSISLNTLRTSTTDVVTQQLSSLPSGSVCCVNAVSIRDIEVFVAGLLKAQNAGHEFVFRTAASFVQAYAGLEQRPLLATDAMIDPTIDAGLIIVGSYVPKTTIQLKHLVDHATDLEAVELQIDLVLQDDNQAYLTEIHSQIDQTLQSGKNVVLHTSRDLKSGSNAETSLKIGNQVSNALVQIVQSIERPLRFVIAKGGITSSDIATKALAVKRAIVLGQILPGIPVWKTQTESRRPNLSYVVFPGNVGDESALLQAYNKLK
ncbi:MAG: four-carbon acid sugar kinase family protein [Fuerstiella sp.]